MEAGSPAGTVVLITRLSRAVYRRVGEDMLGMRLKEFVLLSRLRSSAGEPQKELAEAMMMDANNLVILLNGLEEHGFATRERDAHDRRRHLVRITDDGRAALVAAEAAMDSTDDDVLGALDAAERAQLRHLLAKALGDDE